MTSDNQPDDGAEPTDAQQRALDDELRDVKALIARCPLKEVDMERVRDGAVRQVWWTWAAGVAFVLAGLLQLFNALVLRRWPDDALFFSFAGATNVAVGLLMWFKGTRLARECGVDPETIRAARRKQLFKIVPFVIGAASLGLLAAYLSRG